MELKCPLCDHILLYNPNEYIGEYFLCKNCAKMVLWKDAFDIQDGEVQQVALNSRTIYAHLRDHFDEKKAAAKPVKTKPSRLLTKLGLNFLK